MTNNKQPLPVPGTWPEAYEVHRDEAQARIILRTRFYEVQHDLRQGGAICSVVLFHGTGENLLAMPIFSEVEVTGGATYGDLYDASPDCHVEEIGDDVVVTFEGKLGLKPLANAASGSAWHDIGYRTIYTYRWGHIRVRRQFVFPDEGVAISRLLVHEWALRPDLSYYGVRSGRPAKDLTDCGESDWGRARPGIAFDYPYRDRHLPRHVVFGNPGREGIEWFMSSDLAQWTYDICGEPGHGDLWIGPQAKPALAVVFKISAVLAPRPDLRRSERVLKGTKTFDYVIGLPVISGQAHKPYLHKSFNRHAWPTDQTIASWAQQGVVAAHLHHDGDTFHDGLFWRDGTYPPFGPEDMAEFDRVIASCHRDGIRVATYFSNKELHPITEAFKKHGKEWARLPDGQTIVHNPYSGDEYGGQMCLRSGWLDFFKQYVDTILSHHALDGIYYDWNQAIICNNPAHSSRPCGNLEPRESLIADSPAAHWDMDELIDLMQWTRRRVGPDGLVMIHNTMSPCAVTENFADYVVAMEWGSGKLSVDTPSLHDLPLEWSYFGARSRAVIEYGCLERDATTSLRRKFVLQCMLTGVAPWHASDITLGMFAPLLGSDLSTYRFLDWRSGAVEVEGPSLFAAAYDRTDRAVVLVANFGDQLAKGNVKLRRECFHLSVARKYEVSRGGVSQLLDYKSFTSGLQVDVPPESVLVMCIEPAGE